MQGKYINTQIRITCASSTRSKKKEQLVRRGCDFLMRQEIFWTKVSDRNPGNTAKLVA